MGRALLVLSLVACTKIIAVRAPRDSTAADCIERCNLTWTDPEHRVDCATQCPGAVTTGDACSSDNLAVVASRACVDAQQADGAPIATVILAVVVAAAAVLAYVALLKIGNAS